MTRENEDVFACVDCRHSKISILDWLFDLGRPDKHLYKCSKLKYSLGYNDSVIGNRDIKSEFYTCGVAREQEKLCGRKGKYWTPKRKKDLFRLLKKDY